TPRKSYPTLTQFFKKIASARALLRIKELSFLKIKPKQDANFLIYNYLNQFNQSPILTSINCIFAPS
ncbi:hypothetical protein, partial [Leeuwenhoekiella blandensis]|uniref:hypothetical protein n=1 Tax=Leeuwenhoekiella blandensis TaxID=360293 RepID=UPI002357CA34